MSAQRKISHVHLDTELESILLLPEEHLHMFEDEMQSAEVEYELIRLDNAQHGFANPEDAGFDERLAEEMWERILGWIEEK